MAIVVKTEAWAYPGRDPMVYVQLDCGHAETLVRQLTPEIAPGAELTCARCEAPVVSAIVSSRELERAAKELAEQVLAILGEEQPVLARSAERVLAWLD